MTTTTTITCCFCDAAVKANKNGKAARHGFSAGRINHTESCPGSGNVAGAVGLVAVRAEAVRMAAMFAGTRHEAGYAAVVTACDARVATEV